jgi:hypothetical protein
LQRELCSVQHSDGFFQLWYARVKGHQESVLHVLHVLSETLCHLNHVRHIPVQDLGYEDLEARPQIQLLDVEAFQDVLHLVKSCVGEGREVEERMKREEKRGERRRKVRAD